MQESLTTSPQWVQTALQVVASILAGVGIDRLYNTWLNRKKPAAEINVTEATAAEVTVRAGSNAGDAIIRMMVHLERAQQTIDRLREERDAWQDQYDQVFVQRDELLRQNSLLQKEVNSYEGQMTTMRATLKSNRLNYDNTQDDKLVDPSKHT